LFVGIAFAAFSPEASAEGLIGLAFAAPLAIGMIENSVEARQHRSDVWDQMESMMNLRKSEKREFTEDEAKKYNELRSEFDKLTDKVKELEADEKRRLEMVGLSVQKRFSQKEERDLSKYSLKRAITLQASGKPLDGIEAEMHEEAAEEARNNGVALDGFGIPTMILDQLHNKRSMQKRAMSATGTTSEAGDQGGMAIITEKQGLIEALRPLLVLSGLGVRTMGGLTGNIDLVKGTSTVAAWETETGDADETGSTISKASFSPKRLAAYGVISRQLLNQSEINFETFFLNDLLRAIAQAVESAAISGASGGSNPVGILSTSGIGSVVGGVDGLAMAWEHVVKLEKEVAIDNALMGSLGYLTNTKVKAALKTKALDAGSGLFVWPQSENVLNGYPVAVSNLVPSNLTKVNGGTTHTDLSAAIFGNWNDMMIGQWGGIDMIVDQYSLKKKGQIEIATNSFWDVLIRRPESFAAMVDIIT
jgi:HK97 family phage major capsid protein